MTQILAIALGGALGALLRHFAGAAFLHSAGPAFPWGTLAVNILGAFALGLIAGIGATGVQMGEAARAFLVVGLLGGFTTFSAFSLEIVLMFERGQTLQGLAYAGGSVLAGVLALALGLLIMRAMV